MIVDIDFSNGKSFQIGPRGSSHITKIFDFIYQNYVKTALFKGEIRTFSRGRFPDPPILLGGEPPRPFPPASYGR